MLFTSIQGVYGTMNEYLGRFNAEKDLLLVQFDCKTDVDDVQSAAALATLLNNERFSAIRYHAVAGTYGIQEGLYVPANELFRLAFGSNWSDAHEHAEKAVDEVMALIRTTLLNQGDIWIAEAGQSDFTALLVKAIQSSLPDISVSERIHVVQHSDWNENSTSAENLQFVKANTDYYKIADGNVVGNGTPGFRSPEFTKWRTCLKNPKLIEIWQLAIDISNKYNGREGRYKNEAIAAGGLDFSDLSEVCWILGLENIKDTGEFFRIFH
jgi:hypothetical protein